MKILAIESSGPVASAAILENDTVLVEKEGPFKVTHSETLMPMVAEAFAETGLAPADVDLIAVSGGPGSFTGLRIGSATAKALGLALDKPLVHVPTLDGMAYNFEGSTQRIVPLMDARRSQVYTGIYVFEEGKLKVELEGRPMAADELMEKLNKEFNDRGIIFLGDGIEPAMETIRSLLKVPYVLAEGTDRLQRAGSVGRLGAVLAAEGKTVHADAEAPVYLRPSQAERVRAEKLAGK